MIEKIFQTALKESLKNQPYGGKSKVAEMAGLSRQQLQHIEVGRQYGDENQRRAIAAALGYPGRAYEDFLDIGRKILVLPVEPKNGREPLKVKNSLGWPVGFILSELIFQEPGAPSINEIARLTGIDVPTLEDIFSNKICPSFQHLEAFYNKLKINPAILFINPQQNPQLAYMVDDLLLNLLIAAGYLKDGEQPNDAHLQMIFGIEAKEAMKILKEWKEIPLTDQESGPFHLPRRLLAKLQENYEIDPVSIYDGKLILKKKIAIPAKTEAVPPPAPEYKQVLDIVLTLDQAELATVQGLLAVLGKMEGKFVHGGAGLQNKPGRVNAKRGQRAAPLLKQELEVGFRSKTGSQQTVIQADEKAGVNGANKK